MTMTTLAALIDSAREHVEMMFDTLELLRHNLASPSDLERELSALLAILRGAAAAEKLRP
jgi:hypothetical protein